MTIPTELPTSSEDILQSLAATLEQLGITQKYGQATINSLFFDPNNPNMTNNDILLAAAFLGTQLPKEALVNLSFAPPNAIEEAQIQTQAFAGLNAREFHIETAPNVSIQAWYIKPEPGKATILFSNGADGDFMRSRELIAQLKNEGYGVLTYQYRGYGAGQGGSSGITTEQGMYSDLKVLSDLLAHGSPENGIVKTTYSKQVLMGYSLGGDVSAHVAAESGHHYKSLVLIDTPKSIEDAFKAEIQNADPLVKSLTAPFQAGIIAAEQKLQGAFDISNDISHMHIPTLFVEGQKDQLALPAIERQLFDSEHYPLKSYFSVSSADHDSILGNLTYADKVADRIDQFLDPCDYNRVVQDISNYCCGISHGANTHFTSHTNQPNSMALLMSGHHSA